MKKRIKNKKCINKKNRFKKKKKCGDLFMVRTGNVDISCNGLTSTEIWK